jgi:EamA-like transporter family.
VAWVLLSEFLFNAYATQLESVRTKAGFRVAEVRWLLGAIAAGGVAGPALLMLGLSTTPAATSSLLLNLEGVFTAVIAWVVFRENVDVQIFLGMVAIVLGGCAFVAA